MAMMILLRTLPQSEFSAVEPGELDYSGKNDDEIRRSLSIFHFAPRQLSGQPAIRFDRLGESSTVRQASMLATAASIRGVVFWQSVNNKEQIVSEFNCALEAQW